MRAGDFELHKPTVLTEECSHAATIGPVLNTKSSISYSFIIFIPSFIHSFSQSESHSFNHSFILDSFIIHLSSFINSFVHPFVNSLIRSFRGRLLSYS